LRYDTINLRTARQAMNPKDIIIQLPIGARLTLADILSLNK
jgi:hypothetical protein